MFPNQPGQPNQPYQQPQPVQPYPQASYVTPSTTNQPPDKKLVIIGGGVLLLVLIIVGVLLLNGGGGNDNSLTWQRIIANENQIPVITQTYQQDLTSRDVQNASATTQITWMSNNKNVASTYARILGKTATQPNALIDAKTKKLLDDAKTAGNLDSALANTIINQVNLVDKDVQTILASNPSSQTKAQLQATDSLAKSTIKQLQSALNTLNN